MLGRASGLSHFGIYKLCSVPCITEKKYVQSRDWTCVRPGFLNLPDGRPDVDSPCCPRCHQPFNVFHPTHDKIGFKHYCSSSSENEVFYRRYKVQRKYRTIWRTFWSPRYVVSSDPVSSRDALCYRLLSAREGDIARHEELFANQCKCVRDSPTYNNILRILRERTLCSPELNLPFEDQYVHYGIQRDHVKYKLRMSELKRYYDNIRLDRKTAGSDSICLPFSNFDFVEYVIAKFKYEWVKYGKFARNVVDLTCLGSLPGGFAAKHFKKVLSMCDPFQEWRFVAEPDLDVIHQVFRDLIAPLSDIFFVCFSDDSCLSLRCRDGIFKCNLDIVSADSSAGNEIFESLLRCTEGSESSWIFKLCIRQCMAPLKWSHPYYKWDTIYEPNSPKLYSGSVLTTIINTLGSLLIYASIRDNFTSSSLSMAEAPSFIKRCANDAGYNVTVEQCLCDEDFQFLKCSPSDDGVPYVNLGVLLRCIGSCDGDLPILKGESLEVACRRRDSSIVKGMVHAGDHFLTTALRFWFIQAGDDPPLYENYILQNLSGGSVRSISYASICRRYNLSTTDVVELLFYIPLMYIGTSLNCVAVRKIMMKDYGYVYEGEDSTPEYSFSYLWNFSVKTFHDWFWHAKSESR